LSLLRAFLFPIALADLELQISNAVLNISINLIVASEFKNYFNLRLLLQNLSASATDWLKS